MVDSCLEAFAISPAIVVNAPFILQNTLASKEVLAYLRPGIEWRELSSAIGLCACRASCFERIIVAPFLSQCMVTMHGALCVHCALRPFFPLYLPLLWDGMAEVGSVENLPHPPSGPHTHQAFDVEWKEPVATIMDLQQLISTEIR